MSFDLDKVLAEEEGLDPYHFDFDGHTYELPPVLDIRAIAAISAGRLDDGLRLLLNPDQWQAIQDSPKLLTSRALRLLFDDYVAYAENVSLGESSGSTNSSPNTAEPSKPTSNGSTPSAGEPSDEVRTV